MDDWWNVQEQDVLGPGFIYLIYCREGGQGCLGSVGDLLRHSEAACPKKSLVEGIPAISGFVLVPLVVGDRGRSRDFLYVS